MRFVKPSPQLGIVFVYPRHLSWTRQHAESVSQTSLKSALMRFAWVGRFVHVKSLK